MARVWERYRAEGLSDVATEILLSSRNESTQKSYLGPSNTCSSRCSERFLCPFTTPVNSVLTSLAELAQQGKLNYGTIGVYK